MPAGRLADTVGRRPTMIIGSAVATLSMGLLASFGSLGVYVLAMTLFGAASAFLAVAPSAAVGDVVEGRGGTVVAAFQMSSDLGAVVGPLVAGWLADQYSFSAAFAATTGVVAVGLIAAIASRETTHQARPDPEPETTPAPTPVRPDRRATLGPDTLACRGREVTLAAAGRPGQRKALCSSRAAASG